MTNGGVPSRSRVSITLYFSLPADSCYSIKTLLMADGSGHKCTPNFTVTVIIPSMTAHRHWKN